MRKSERLATVVGHPISAWLLKFFFRSPGILCVTHHRIADTVEHDPDVISATPDQLRRQVDWLQSRFTILSGEEVVDVLANRRTLSGPAVSVTFDDGYVDNYAAGRMLMEEFGIPATFFIPTAYIGTGRLPAWDRLGFSVRHATARVIHIPPLGDRDALALDVTNYDLTISTLMSTLSSLPSCDHDAFVESIENATGARALSDATASPFMTWDQIRALRRMGHTIGAHTHTHPVLAALSPDEQTLEIAHSKNVLQRELNEPVRVFAYPYGKPRRSFSEATKGLVRSLGFEGAFSFYGGWNRPNGTDLFDIRRIKVDLDTSLPMFRTRITTRGLIPV